MSSAMYTVAGYIFQELRQHIKRSSKKEKADMLMALVEGRTEYFSCLSTSVENPGDAFHRHA